MFKIETILKMRQNELASFIRKRFKKQIHSEVKGSYILIKGNLPVLLIAHLDTVHEKIPELIISDGRYMTSPQGIGGDDRCGVYALCKIYEQTRRKPWLIFTYDEEVGCIGANDFCMDIPTNLPEFKFLIEVDRRGTNDCVFYDCYNPDFESWINEYGFETEYGSCSDISYIAPELGCAAVNLSAGYFNEHNKNEYIDLSALEYNIERIKQILKDSNKQDRFTFEYWDYEYSMIDSLSDEDYELFWIVADYYGYNDIEQILNDYGMVTVKELYKDMIGETR